MAGVPGIQALVWLYERGMVRFRPYHITISLLHLSESPFPSFPSRLSRPSRPPVTFA